MNKDETDEEKKLCEKCKEEYLIKEGDNEILFTGDYIRISLWLGKKLKDQKPDENSLMIEFGNVSIGLSIDQFKEFANGVSKTKDAIETRLQFEI